MFERALIVPRTSRWATAGGLAVLLAVSPALAGCEDGWPGASKYGAISTLPKDEHLAVDCTANPDTSAAKKIQVGRYVQILKLQVKGADYNDAWRVQLFPGESDLNLSNPEGQPPKRAVSPSALAGGTPTVIALAHGSLSVQRADAGLQQEPQPNPSESMPPAVMPHAPVRLFDFSFALSCTTPEGALPLQQ
jgi:hypothetical protein